jgi:two-component system, chemotaxis family, chemotaxis protein CheY
VSGASGIDAGAAGVYTKPMAKVLVVDDSAITRAMIGEFLILNGHQVAGEAENKAQALAVYAARRPDLVTLDLSMGEDDGFAVLAALLHVDAKARVLIVSANTQQEVYDDLMRSGAAGFLTKPFKIDELSAAVAKAVAS